MLHRSIIQPAQIRMARAALSWTIPQLSGASGVSERTIRRLEVETPGERANVTIGTMERIVSTFQRAGLVFVCSGTDGYGAGVRFRVPDDDDGFQPATKRRNRATP